jgi:hypothetical protein
MRDVVKEDEKCMQGKKGEKKERFLKTGRK